MSKKSLKTWKLSLKTCKHNKKSCNPQGVNNSNAMQFWMQQYYQYFFNASPIVETNGGKNFRFHRKPFFSSFTRYLDNTIWNAFVLWKLIWTTSKITKQNHHWMSTSWIFFLLTISWNQNVCSWVVKTNNAPVWCIALWERYIMTGKNQKGILVFYISAVITKEQLYQILSKVNYDQWDVEKLVFRSDFLERRNDMVWK